MGRLFRPHHTYRALWHWLDAAQASRAHGASRRCPERSEAEWRNSTEDEGAEAPSQNKKGDPVTRATPSPAPLRS